MKKLLSMLLACLLLMSSLPNVFIYNTSAAVAGDLITNGDFETATGFTQDSITNRFPSPFYASPAWTTADTFHKWFRATTGNAAIYSNIITDPANSNNKIARAMQTAMQGVTVGAGKTYQLTFSAKADYAFQYFTVAFADVAAAGTNSSHPIFYPITSASGTKTYDNAGTPVVQNISPYYELGTEIRMPLDTDKWSTYNLLITVGSALTTSQLCALRFGCDDYSSTVGAPANAPYYLDNVSLVEVSVINSSVEYVSGKVGGYLSTPSQIGAPIGQAVTITAVPYPGNTFLGWYLGDALASIDVQYTFTVSGAATYVAKFSMEAPVSIPKEFFIPDIAGEYKTQGRTSIINNKLYLDYTASSFEFNANCKGDVKVSFSASSINLATGFGVYFTVLIDGVEQNRDNFHITTNGDITLTIASNLPEGPHTFQIFRQNELYLGIIAIKSITIEGQLTAKPADKNLFIEFLGDSITAGYGNLTTNAVTSASTPPANASIYQDGTKTYASYAAQALNADISAVAVSGIGAYIGGTTDNAYKVYPYTRYGHDATTAWNFAKQPDIVVINLGTNDMYQYLTKGKTLDEVKKGFSDLLGLVREKNPNAAIVWAHGLMTTNADTLISQVISEAGGASNNYYHVSLTLNVLGGGTHPTVAGQQTAANDLTKFINETVLNTDTHTPGDVNGNGEVDLADITVLSRYVASWQGLTYDEYALDVNDDGMVDLADVTILSRFVAGWSVTVH